MSVAVVDEASDDESDERRPMGNGLLGAELHSDLPGLLILLALFYYGSNSVSRK
jgi:hypothetical protein